MPSDKSNTLTETYNFIPVTPAEKAALEHRDRIIKTHGSHSRTSCPPMTRAMCSHGAALDSVEQRTSDAPTTGTERAT